MENSLPKGWVETLLKDAAFFQEGPGLRTFQMGKKGIPFLNIRTFNDDETLDKSKCKFVKLEEFKNKYEHFSLQEGDIVVSSSGTLGKTIVIRKQDLPVMLNTSVIRFRSHSEEVLAQKFLKYFLKTEMFYRQIQEQKTGMAIDNFGPSHLQKMKIVIPPLREQHRIVAKLDELMEKIDRARARLAHIPEILKRFRQSILAAAVSGRLTEEWRGSDVEVERIPLGELIEDLKYGTSQKSEKNIKGIPILRIPNIGEGAIVLDDLKYSKLSKKEYEKLKLIPGDILLIRSNGSVSLIGKAAIVSETEAGFAYAGYLIRVRCDKSKILPEFLNLALASNDIRVQIEVNARSTSGVNNINSEEVRVLEIPTPSIDEQTEVIKTVKQLFTLTDKIDARYHKAKAQLDKLPQSLLAKAFRGELVAQNPEDERAGVLLERIKAEKQGKVVKKVKRYKMEEEMAVAAEIKSNYSKG